MNNYSVLFLYEQKKEDNTVWFQKSNIKTIFSLPYSFILPSYEEENIKVKNFRIKKKKKITFICQRGLISERIFYELDHCLEQKQLWWQLWWMHSTIYCSNEFLAMATLVMVENFQTFTFPLKNLQFISWLNMQSLKMALSVK